MVKVSTITFLSQNRDSVFLTSIHNEWDCEKGCEDSRYIVLHQVERSQQQIMADLGKNCVAVCSYIKDLYPIVKHILPEVE